MTLIKTLAYHTQELKDTYIEKCIEHAEKDYQGAVERMSWSDEQWCRFMGLTPVKDQGKLTFPRNFYNSENAREYRKALDKARSTVRQGRVLFIKKAVEKAIKHYDNFLEKLAKRIEKKGLDTMNFQMSSGWVGVNLEMVFTDGNQTVKAWTIVAWGDVQRPHYRYLVK